MALKIAMKKETLIEIISALFILLFVYTGYNKFLAIGTLKYVLKDYPLIGSMSNTIAWALPMIEFAVSLLLLIPKTRLIGFYGSLILMSLFTIYLVYMMIFAKNMPCTCGGMLQNLTWNEHLLFNIFFVVLSILGIKLKKRVLLTSHTKIQRVAMT